MPRGRRTGLKFSQAQAAQALHHLISEGKVAAADVHGALKRREKLIGELRARLAALTKDGPFPMKSARARTLTRRTARTVSRRVSAARRAAMKAHGHYLAAISRLPKASRVKIKTIREKSGVRAAIAAAKRMGT